MYDSNNETARLYFLPSHPSVISRDPLGICDGDNPTAWAVITESIRAFRAQSQHTIHQLPQLIEDLSYSVKMDGTVNTKFLATFLGETFPDPENLESSEILHSILDAALAIPIHFPSHTLRYLGTTQPSCNLNSSQIVSLLAHQILNTLSPPPSNDWGCTFTVWYSEPQALAYAVTGYLRTLFELFRQKAWSGISIAFQYHTQAAQVTAEKELEIWRNCMNMNLFSSIFIERVSIKNTPFPHGRVPCTLVASNKSPGFGPACTQEELVTAACPPLLLFGALFVRPPIPADAVLIAHGNVPLALWKGQGRYARYQGTTGSRRHTFLLLDAAELDTNDHAAIPDLRVDNFTRDLHKAYIGFSSLAALGQEDIASPLWGAGSFGGNPVIKFLILAAAAARAGINVHVAVEGERSLSQNVSVSSVPEDLFSNLEELKRRCAGMSVGEMVCKLTCEQAKCISNTVDLLSFL